MVSSFQHLKFPMLPYLKPCQPAPGVASRLPAVDPFDDKPPDGRRLRMLSLLLCTAHLAATAFGLWTWTPVSSVAVETQAKAVSPSVSPSEGLWNALGSDELTRTISTAKREQTDATLAAAERDRLQAQQLRLDAEARAKNLTDSAASQARQTTVEARRRADAIALDASYIGAEQVIYAEAGSEISLKFDARIQCKDGSFGETAVASPTDSRIVPREVRNLAVCYSSPQTAAGQPIGESGEWGVAFFEVNAP